MEGFLKVITKRPFFVAIATLWLVKTPVADCYQNNLELCKSIQLNLYVVSFPYINIVPAIQNICYFYICLQIFYSLAHLHYSKKLVGIKDKYEEIRERGIQTGLPHKHFTPTDKLIKKTEEDINNILKNPPI